MESPFTLNFYKRFEIIDNPVTRFVFEPEDEEDEIMVCQKCHDIKGIEEMDKKISGYCIDCVDDAIQEARKLLKPLSASDYAIVNMILDLVED
jgi:hypothetical protein